MKKLIRVVVLVLVVFVVGIVGFDFISQMPEEWLLAVGVPLAGLAIGLGIGLPLQAYFTRKNQSHEQHNRGSDA